MPRLSRAQELARQQIAHLASSGLPTSQLGERLLAALQLAVPSDGGQLCAVDPTTLLFNRLLAVSPEMRSHTQWYLQNLYLKEPVADFGHPSLMRAHLTAVVLHDRPETSWGLPRDLTSRLPASELYRAYHEFTGAAGGILRAFFPAEGQWLGALDLARFDSKEPFRATDVTFLRLVAPLIGRALRLALDRECAVGGANAANIDSCGVLMLAPNGCIQSYTPAAESWLNLLQDIVVFQEKQLPTVIWSVIAGLRAGGQQSTQACVRVSTPRGLLRIEAAPMGADGTIAVVLAPYCQPASPGIPAEWNLTRQERQVVEQVVHGLSNRQVAGRLVISENTVESHLKHVYEKLNVHSRSQLLARYFAETYNSDFFDPDSLSIASH